MKRTLTCVVCPVGCEITVDYEGTEVKSVTGNTCKRGDAYARNEIVAPSRTLTTTVRVKGGEMPLVPVKTSKPIPKNMLFEAMKKADAYAADAPVKCGDVLIKDFIEEGTNLVACRDIAKI